VTTRQHSLSSALLFFLLTAAALASGAVGCGSSDAVGEGNEVVERDDVDEPTDPAASSSASAGQGGGGDEGPGSGGAGTGGQDAGVGGAGTGGSKPNGTGSSNDCCATNTTLGCSDLATESCVCAIDAYCCTTAWDELCVGVAQNSCNACGGPETVPEPTPEDGGNDDDCKECILGECGLECLVEGCCADSLHSMVTECLLDTCAYECFGWEPSGGEQAPSCSCDVTAGCDGCWCEPASECTTESSCWCDTTWGCDGCDCDPECGGDSGCSCDVSYACDVGCESCDPECTPEPDPWFGTCCEASSWATGCDNTTIEECVCGYDSYCCTTAWDDECVGKVEWCGYGSCG
jgi:hypothetical protein